MISKKILAVAVAAHMVSACSTNRYGNTEFIGLDSDDG